jgi:hypothetical protein
MVAATAWSISTWLSMVGVAVFSATTVPITTSQEGRQNNAMIASATGTFIRSIISPCFDELCHILRYQQKKFNASDIYQARKSRPVQFSIVGD